MKRWHPPETKTPSSPHVPSPPAGASVALEKQIHALRDALDRAARAGEKALHESKALREALHGERLRNSELTTRYKDMQRFHNATTVGEVEALKVENRRLRTMIGEASSERGKLIEEIRIRAPFERFEPAELKEVPGVAFESPEAAPCRSGGPGHRQHAPRK